jgi:hypothetical protein
MLGRHATQGGANAAAAGAAVREGTPVVEPQREILLCPLWGVPARVGRAGSNALIRGNVGVLGTHRLKIRYHSRNDTMAITQFCRSLQVEGSGRFWNPTGVSTDRGLE